MSGSGVNWEQKYKNMRSNFLSALDVAYRNGYEQGMNDSQAESVQQQAQALAQQQAAAMGGQMPMGGQMDQGQPPQQDPMPQGAENDELGMAISELEELVNKAESSDLKTKLSKSLEAMKLTKSTKDLQRMMLAKNKGKESVVGREIVKSMRMNLPSDVKRSVSEQNIIINNLFKKWDAEANQTKNSVLDVLGLEKLKKDE